MKIAELFETRNFPEASGPINPDEIKEVAKVIQQVKQSDTYAKMLELFDDVTRPVALRNGTLTFKPKDGSDKKMVQGFYKVSRNGQIRLTNDSTQRPQHVRVSSPEPAVDLYDRYINALEEILKKFQRRNSIANRLVRITPRRKSLQEIEFPDPTSSIEIHTNVALEDLKGCPAKISAGMTIYDASVLKSLEGMPRRIGGTLTIQKCPNLTSLDGIAQYVNNVSLMQLPNIKSLSGIHKQIKQCNGWFSINDDCKGAILGLLRIPGIDHISSGGGWTVEKLTDLQRAVAILNMFLKSKNILACQEKLIDNGLKDYAEF
jgi:hypothetical protein